MARALERRRVALLHRQPCAHTMKVGGGGTCFGRRVCLFSYLFETSRHGTCCSNALDWLSALTLKENARA